MSKATVYSKTKMGEIPSVKFGETIRVKESDLENYIDSNIHKPKEG
jgi:excisionase family DNA binding protein